MKIKRFIPASNPTDVIFKAHEDGLLDDRDCPVYAGLDDAGFDAKSDSLKAKYELERLMAENEDHSKIEFDFGRLPNRRYVEYEHDDDMLYYRILDDDGNVVGYYAVSCDGPEDIGKAFVFSDEVGDDSDEERIMFHLLNRMSEAFSKANEIFWSTRGDSEPSRTVIEFDGGSRRFAAGSHRPKKAAYSDKSSDFDRFAMGLACGNRRGLDTVECPEGMILE